MEVKKTNTGKIRIELSCEEGFMDVKKDGVWIDLEVDEADFLCTLLVEELGKEGRYHLY